MAIAAIAYKVVGEVEKIVNSNGRIQGYGVLMEIYFPDGEKRQYRYTARRKRDVLAAMNNGKMARWVDRASLDNRGKLVFQIDLC
jgi:hypothetical protein